MKRIIVYILILILLTLFLSFFHNYILDLDKYKLAASFENLTKSQINNITANSNKTNWVGLFDIIINLIIKVITVSIILVFGVFLFKINVKYADLLLIIIRAEYIFLCPIIYEIIWFYFFQTNYTLEDIQYFYPLSALNIMGYQDLDPWLIYPLQVFNLFELVYIIYLSYQIGQLTKTNTDNGLKIVGYSYVPALFLWVTVVMFFTLNYS
jgi:hypothetical protein